VNLTESRARSTTNQPSARRPERNLWLVIAALAAFLIAPLGAIGQDTPKFVINADCQAFDISSNDEIVYAVPHLKHIKRLMIERDDIWISGGPGKDRHIVDADKFMPIPPVSGFQVNSLKWAPDGHHFAADITVLNAPAGYEEKENKKRGHEGDIERERGDDATVQGVGGGRAVVFFDDSGHEIKVAGSKTRFIENASDATWLADGVTAVFINEDHQIARVRPADGQTSTLFAGHNFDAIVWDAPHNRAFAVGENLSVRGNLALVRLDLLRETVTVVNQLDNFQGKLTLSYSGDKIAFFIDGDTIQVIDFKHPAKSLTVNAGMGQIQFGRDEDRILLKRGPDDRSGDLVWVRLNDDTFAPALHGLEFHAFRISPSGDLIAVAEPGKEVLVVYPLE
jgi:hypothetical protein